MNAASQNPLELLMRLLREVPMGTGHIKNCAEAHAIVAELVAAARPLAKSLTRRITADNAMTPQACMVRRLNAALAAFPE